MIDLRKIAQEMASDLGQQDEEKPDHVNFPAQYILNLLERVDANARRETWEKAAELYHEKAKEPNQSVFGQGEIAAYEHCASLAEFRARDRQKETE